MWFQAENILIKISVTGALINTDRKENAIRRIHNLQVLIFVPIWLLKTFEAGRVLLACWL